MNRIARAFARLARKRQKALVGFVTAGDPTVERSEAVIRALCRSGLDMLELGVPFSNPWADGPVIKRSHMRGLADGTTLGTVFAMTSSLRKSFQLPVILFSYYAPINEYGIHAFCLDAKRSGADGVLVPELPPDASKDLASCCKEEDLSLIRTIKPSTPEECIAAISEAASGFIYIVSMEGVTGGSGLNLSQVGWLCRKARRYTKLPLCVGFGISSVQDVVGVSGLADGVIIGSAFERLIEEHGEAADLAEIIAKRTAQYKEATKSSY